MMVYLLHLFIGFLMAFLGLLTPGLLTMTTIDTSLDRGSKEAVKFSFGVVIPIIIQAHIALLGAEYLHEHPEVIKSFSKIAVFIFWGLSYIFWRQYNRRHVVKKSGINIRNPYLYGLVISLINPMAIPFYFTYSSLLEMQGILKLDEPYVSVFVLGAIMGAFAILHTYAKHAHRFIHRIQFIAKNFNLILALVMFFLGLSALVNSLW